MTAKPIRSSKIALFGIACHLSLHSSALTNPRARGVSRRARSRGPMSLRKTTTDVLHNICNIHANPLIFRTVYRGQRYKTVAIKRLIRRTRMVFSDDVLTRGNLIQPFQSCARLVLTVIRHSDPHIAGDARAVRWSAFEHAIVTLMIKSFY